MLLSFEWSGSQWQKKWRPVSGAVLMASGLLALLILISDSELLQPEKLLVRQVQFAIPPPPPPPPPTTSQPTAEAPALDIALSGDGPTLMTTHIEIKGVTAIEELAPPEPPTLTPNWDNLLQPDWNTVGLEQLDSAPRLLSNLNIEYPSALSRRGVNKVNLEVDVMIDESGNVILRQILGAPPTEIIAPLKSLIKKARFTAPLKDGVAVRAAFIWPLEFSK
ncbi:energy transducer TonB [Planctobacterium marinum]|uniref:energy transducer TonB n=1 Tax=Planctobacterium marinum TaxID=1631968 RepID=UPI001E4637A1|nr:energy transducer TonB [Planctobacterium marinum]MCC2603962.1 energy transducer TonB [Planctobacterium marinum]